MKKSTGKEILSQAKWLWPVSSYYDLINTYAHFRKDFIMDQLPEKAMFYVTADQCYRLWINGRYVTRGPARGYQEHWPFDEVDAVPYLLPGNNHISIEVYNGGVSTFGYITQTKAGMLCGGNFGSVEIRSDSTWICRMDASHKRDTQKYSLQLNFQEHVNTRKDDRTWITSPNKPAGWKNPETVEYGSMPWHDLEERGTPQLREVAKAPLRILTIGEGKNAAGYKNIRNITAANYKEFNNTFWETQKGMETESGLFTVPSSGKGKFKAFVLDFGELVVGPCKVSAEDGKPGQIIDFFFHERITEKSTPLLLNPETLQSMMSMSNRLILSGSKVIYDFHQILGFRYVTVIVRDNSHPLNIRLEVLDTGYPYTLTGSFECSDQSLNDIWKICQRTEQVCSLDSYVDTPWREQAQWWGDARIQFWNTMAMDGDVRLFIRGIRSIAGQKAPNGLTYGHAPTMAHNCILPDFSLVWVMTVYDYLRQTGDISLFEEQLPVILKVMEYFKKDAPHHKGLIGYDKRYWLFLDWSTLKIDGFPALYNMWYLMALRALASLYKQAGRMEDSLKMTEECSTLQKAVEDALFDKKAGLFCDGLDLDGRKQGIHSVHSQTMAILLDLKPGMHQNMLEKRILPFLRGEKLDVPVPSTYWTSYVLTAAREKGYAGEALGFIKRMWSPMIPLGTCPETFDGAAGEYSASHAWSAHPIFHLMNLPGGIVQKDNGWKTIIYEPYFDKDLSYVKVGHPSPYGLIESSWKRDGMAINIELKLPEGMTAVVKIPGYEKEVSGSFKAVIRN